jgi:hypothetical protein
MRWLRKKRKFGHLPGFLSRHLQSLQIRFAMVMSKKERQFSVRKRKITLLAFCCFITVIQLLRLYQMIEGDQPHRHSFPPRQPVATPKDITLPDSLDIEMIRQYRELKRKQDSLSRKKKL